MDRWTSVCRISDLQPDSGVCALVEGRQIALFYLPKEQAVFALDNFDPIGKANVLSRGIIGDLGGEPVVASPLYKEHYNLRTGECLEDKLIRVRVYSARIANGRVEICLPPDEVERVSNAGLNGEAL